jgi:hypothetical protein
MRGWTNRGYYFRMYETLCLTPVDEALWHKCRAPIIPRRTIDGRWAMEPGQTWRRKRPDGKWEYRQDNETVDEWLDRLF